MNIFKRIKATSTKKNRRSGQIATAIGGIAEAIVMTGAFESRPQINTVLHVVAFAFGSKAVWHATQTAETLDKDEPFTNDL